MVRTYNRRLMLARVSIVDSNSNTIYDSYVKPTKYVEDYCTPVSGIRPENINNGELFTEVRECVSRLLKGKILVGHTLSSDLCVLKIQHPQDMIREIRTYSQFQIVTKGQIPGLKLLASHFLNINIQQNEHDSVEDAKAAMQLYMLVREDWEKSISEPNREK